MKCPRFVRATLRRRVLAILFCNIIGVAGNAQNLGFGGPITLREAFDNALLHNRTLQIEQINQEIASMRLSSAYAYYDPVFTTRVQREEGSDTGGFDPLNFSADAIYSTESDVANVGLAGFLPSGLSYTVNGRFVHSWGTRNFLNFDSYKVDTSVYAEQPLLRNMWIDQPRWQIQVNKQNLKVTELGVQYIVMTVVNQTQLAYYDLAFEWENLRIQRQFANAREELLRGVQQQVRLGAATSLEAKFASSQAALAQTALVNASNRVSLASNALRTFMGVSPENWTQVPLEPADATLTIPENLNLSESWRIGLRQRPDLLQLAINVETADLTVRFWKNQLFPTLSLFGSYGLKGSDAVQAFPPAEPKAQSSLAFRQIENQEAPNSAVGILFSLPLTSRAERANYRSSKETKRQAELLVKQKEEFILREIADAIEQARFNYERAAAARQAVQFSVETAEAQELLQLRGAGSILLVYEAQEDVAVARITEAEARRDYNKALSQLYFTEGSLLDRIQTEIQFK
ncbi:MAG TPA: TolC family protein [Candidatus Kapabacteria bacterium]|nr:TolC family protein [Candidatus Kapabacteria bacterium]